MCSWVAYGAFGEVVVSETSRVVFVVSDRACKCICKSKASCASLTLSWSLAGGACELVEVLDPVARLR